MIKIEDYLSNKKVLLKYSDPRAILLLRLKIPEILKYFSWEISPNLCHLNIKIVNDSRSLLYDANKKVLYIPIFFLEKYSSTFIKILIICSIKRLESRRFPLIIGIDPGKTYAAVFLVSDVIVDQIREVPLNYIIKIFYEILELKDIKKVIRIGSSISLRDLLIIKDIFKNDRQTKIEIVNEKIGALKFKLVKNMIEETNKDILSALSIALTPGLSI